MEPLKSVKQLKSFMEIVSYGRIQSSLGRAHWTIRKLLPRDVSWNKARSSIQPSKKVEFVVSSPQIMIPLVKGFPLTFIWTQPKNLLAHYWHRRSRGSSTLYIILASRFKEQRWTIPLQSAITSRLFSSCGSLSISFFPILSTWSLSRIL